MQSSYPDINVARLNWDLATHSFDRFEEYWKSRDLRFIPESHFRDHKEVWLEIGAGSGWFFVEMARHYPETFFVAVERSRMRGKRLVRKATRSGLENIAGFRGNAIPLMIYGVPSESVDRVYLMYPCPWPKNSQRKNRWYLHPIMPHLVRILKPGGLIVWASDQKFYIDEAHFVCTERFGLKSIVYGELSENPYNDLARFPGGRTKFERTFLSSGLPCYELVVAKN